jgi:hypothetical protein
VTCSRSVVFFWYTGFLHHYIGTYIIFLQKKERELNALKLELMSSNIQSGTTRKKHFFESDV